MDILPSGTRMRLDPASTPLKLVLLTVLDLCLFYMPGPRLMRQQVRGCCVLSCCGHPSIHCKGHVDSRKISKTREKTETFRSCMARLLRSCVQDFVHVKPITQLHPGLCAGQMAQGTPPRRTPRPSQVASTGFINFSMAFLPSLKRSPFKIIFCHELLIIILEPQVLQASNCPSLKT